MMSRILTLLLLLLCCGFHSIASFSFGTRRAQPTLALGMTTSPNDSSQVDLANVGFVLLAGGTGSRMKANMPKQFLPLQGVPVLHHSLDLFLERLPAQGLGYVLYCVLYTIMKWV